MQSFREWLFAHQRKGRIKDLADDVTRNPPAEPWGYFELVTHMHMQRAGKPAMDALKAAVRAYNRTVAKTTSPDVTCQP